MSCRCGCGVEESLLKSGFRRGHWNKTTEGREKIAVKSRGRKPSVETLAKMSSSMKGKNTEPKSAEHRRKLGEVQRGRKQSEVTRQKRSASMRGKHAGEKNPAWIKDRTEQLMRKKMFGIHRGLLGRAMKQIGSRKFDLTVVELGYCPRQLREHIESLFDKNMTWKNHGRGPDRWHIDHVRPVCTFPLGTPASEVNSLENLRPLWETENLRRPKREWIP